MYFKALPTILYPWKDKDKKQRQVIVPDIFRRVHIDKYFKNRLNLVAMYVNDGETAEQVAYNYYGSTKYHWIVLLSNNIVNVVDEWPKGSRQLADYVTDKYGSNNGTDVHHYVESDDSDIIVDWNATRLANGEIKAVTNTDYETDLNETKRQIYLLDKIFLKDIVVQYKKLVK
tara:strand:+ start:15 stop:533 length:519 start_codon:yes stop_codon:yes gene_type:complete